MGPTFMDKKEIFKDSQKNNQFYTDVIEPEMSVFARDYGLEREYESFFPNPNDRYRNYVPVRKFITLFNKYNESKYWYYNGKYYKFMLGMDDAMHDSSEPYYISNETRNMVLIDEGYNKIGIIGYTAKFLIGLILVGLMTSNIDYLPIPIILVLYFLIYEVGKRAGAKLGYLLW